MASPALEPLRFEAAYRVRFDEAGADGLARAASLLRYAQDVAWQHGASLGLTREWYEEQQLLWLVRAVELTIARPVPVGADVRAQTAVIGHRRIWARRRVEFFVDDGGPGAGAAPAAVAETDWVLVGGGGRIMRIPDSFGAAFGVPEAAMEMHRIAAVPAPDPAPPPLHLAVRFAEVDPNGHLNNAVHLDWLDEAVLAAGGAADLGRFPRRYGAEYLQPLQLGAGAIVSAWRQVAVEPESGGDGDVAGATEPGWYGAITRADGVAAGRSRLGLGAALTRAELRPDPR